MERSSNHLSVLVQVSSLMLTMKAITGDESLAVSRVGEMVVESQAGVDVARVAFLLDAIFPVHAIVFAFEAYFRNTNQAVFQLWRSWQHQTGRVPAVEALATPNRPCSSCGGFGNTNQAVFQLWRPWRCSSSDTDDDCGASSSLITFQLLDQVTMTPSGNGGHEVLYITSLLDANCTIVQPGDILGIYSRLSPSPFSYVFSPYAKPGARASFSSDVKADALKPGCNVTFDTLVFPYAFSVAAYYYVIENTTVANWSSAVVCPKDLTIMKPSPPTTTTSHLQSSTVLQGPSGPAGPPGAPGPVGPQGPPGLPGVSCTCIEATTAHSSHNSTAAAPTNLTDWIIVVLIVWLSFISLLLFATIVCVIVIWTRRKTPNSDRQPVSVTAQQTNTPHNALVPHTSLVGEQTHASGNDEYSRPVVAVVSGNTAASRVIVVGGDDDISGDVSGRNGDAEVAEVEKSKRLLSKKSYSDKSKQPREMASVVE